MTLSIVQQERAIAQSFDELSEDYDDGEYNRDDAIKLAKMYFDVSDRDREGFFIDFDQIWELCGYSSKGVAKRTLTERSQLLKLDKHYKIVFCQSAKNPQGGRPSETILLNAKGFCRFASDAKTTQGIILKDFFKYFIANVKRIFQQTRAPTTTRSEDRIETCEVQKSFCQVVKDLGVAERDGMIYMKLNGKTNYTVLGKTKKQLKQDLKITKNSFSTRDYMSQLQLAATRTIELASAMELTKVKPTTSRETMKIHDTKGCGIYNDNGLRILNNSTLSEPMTLYQARKSIIVNTL